jgi:hypothetical protein
MTAILNRADALYVVNTSHLSSVSKLDFSRDLFGERLAGPWFRLGAWTITSTHDARGVEDQVMRQSLLLAPEGFALVFDKLESVGTVFHNLGKSCGSVQNLSGAKEYIYFSFHQFEFPFTLEIGEPPLAVALR